MKVGVDDVEVTVAAGGNLVVYERAVCDVAGRRWKWKERSCHQSVPCVCLNAYVE